MLLIAPLLAVQVAGVKINHRPVDCLVKDRFPSIEAVIEPADGVDWAGRPPQMSLATWAAPVEEPEKGQQKRESPPKPKEEGKAPTASGAPEGAPPAGEPGTKPAVREQGYQIGPEDILRITVYGHEDLTQVVVVQADGTFTYPLIGRAKAVDLTPNELEKTIALRLSQGFVRNPQVTVVVQEYRSKTVFVVGEVARPGTYPLAGSMTVVEMLARAGLTAGAGAEVIIVRPLTDVKGPVLPDDVTREGGLKRQGEVIRVNLRDIQMGRLEKNIVLRPNDTVFVSQAPRFYVSGEVRSPGAFPFTPRLTVRQAISIAGGFTPDASSGHLRVVREVNGKPKGMKISLDDPVQPADTIVVRAKRF